MKENIRSWLANIRMFMRVYDMGYVGVEVEGQEVQIGSFGEWLGQALFWESG